MRYLGILLILLAMRWSWGVVHCPRLVSLATHSHLQSEMELIIQSYISQARPSSLPVVFDYLWTETINENQVKAHFRYTYEDEMDDGVQTEETISGEVLLNRMAQAGDQDSWSLDSVKATQNALVFKEGVVIYPITE